MPKQRSIYKLFTAAMIDILFVIGCVELKPRPSHGDYDIILVKCTICVLHLFSELLILAAFSTTNQCK